MKPLLVKLGGSLARSPTLASWVQVIATQGAGKVVLVPGGGPFADAVREAQDCAGFDDRTAHRMALLAMEQFGLMLCGFHPGLVPAGSSAGIRSALARRKVPVWMASTMALSDPSIPESWDVTSDSLAAWLANRLEASMLLLVKSVRIDEPQPIVEELAARGWVDPSFPQFVANARFQVRLLNQGDVELLKGILLSGNIPPLAEALS
jgi:aspartokinase-like uncharacterized kinase